MSKLDRRKFIAGAVGATGVASIGLIAAKRPYSEPEVVVASGNVDPSIVRPTDKVRLGKSGLTISLVGIGTGSMGWGHSSNQTRLGQEDFTRLIRHAFDNGITFFDLADQYGTHLPFRTAMKGVPRDRYVIQTKSDSRDPNRARQDIDRFLTELDTDHIDSLIIHNVSNGDWSTRFRGVMDVFEEAKESGKIRAHGVTCHSLSALKAAAASDWVQVNQVRFNPRASHADADVQTLSDLFKSMRAKGQGMIGMKVVGQGDLLDGFRPLTAEACFRFQIASGAVDAFVVGPEKIEHIDTLLSGTQVALNELGYHV
jgi:aryl-alcohol dehydrogenase-like predicted oxidoreductase